MNSRTMRLAVGLGGVLATAGLGLGIVQGAFAQSDQPRVRAGEQAAPAPAIPMEQVLAQLKATARCTRSSGSTGSTRSRRRTGKAARSSSTSMRAPARRSRPRKRTTTEPRSVRPELTCSGRARFGSPRNERHAERRRLASLANHVDATPIRGYFAIHPERAFAPRTQQRRSHPWRAAPSGCRAPCARFGRSA